MDFILKKPHPNEKYSIKFRWQILDYFKTHTARECAKKFHLTYNQIIGILETSRRRGLIDGKFKDSRRHDLWSFDEKLVLVRLLGLVSREEIAVTLNRAGQRNIKEFIKNTFNSASKYMHGMPSKWAEELWPGIEINSIKTRAGPTGGRGIFHFKIIPWSDALKIVNKHGPKDLLPIFRAMNKFEHFIWKSKNDRKIRRNIEEICYGKRKITAKQIRNF